MAVSITAERLLEQLNTEEGQHGLDQYISQDMVMFRTSFKRFCVYRLSDNRCLMSATLKGKDSFLAPVVWSSKLQKMVALMKKKVMRVFTVDQINSAEWEALTIPYEVVHMLDVNDEEPLVITSGGMIGWLSQLEDHALSKLADVPLDLKDLHSFSTYKSSSDQSGYQRSVFFVCKDVLYEVKFQRRKLSECASPVCSHSVQAHCISSDGVIYFIDAKNSLAALAVGPFHEPDILQTLDAKFKPVDMIVIDENQLMIAATETATGQGSLLAYNLKFNSFTTLKVHAARFPIDGKRCLAYQNPYLVTQFQDSLYTHVLQTGKINLRNLMGKALKGGGTIKKSQPQFPQTLSSINSNATCPSQVETHCGNAQPAHLLTDMCENVIKQRDEDGISQLIQLAEQLDETSIVLLIEYILSSVTNNEESMEESDQTVQKQLKNPFSTAQQENLVALLSVPFTDSTIANALQRLNCDQAMMLFQFLSGKIGSTQKHGYITPEQVARWCLIILDVFHSQIVRSNKVALIEELRAKIDEHVNMITNLHELQGLMEPVLKEEDGQGKSYKIQRMDFTY